MATILSTLAFVLVVTGGYWIFFIAEKRRKLREGKENDSHARPESIEKY